MILADGRTSTRARGAEFLTTVRRLIIAGLLARFRVGMNVLLHPRVTGTAKRVHDVVVQTMPDRCPRVLLKNSESRPSIRLDGSGGCSQSPVVISEWIGNG